MMEMISWTLLVTKRLVVRGGTNDAGSKSNT